MSYWAKTKKRINEMTINQEKTLMFFLLACPNRNREKINKSIWLLTVAGFIGIDMTPDGSPTIIKLKNIPISLTRKEAHIISKQPWYLWFKYPECEEHNADLRV